MSLRSKDLLGESHCSAAALARERAQRLRDAVQAGYWWVSPSEVAALLEEIASMIEPNG